MKNLGIYYGCALLDETDLVETKNKNRIELEYYGTEKRNRYRFKNQMFYGVSIIKKEYEDDKIKFEKNIVEKVTTDEGVISKVIETLKKHKVTPISLNDVLEDLLKQPEYQIKELFESNAS